MYEDDGQFCPNCDEWVKIENEGNLICSNCHAELVAEMSDSDYEDWHLMKRGIMDKEQRARNLFDKFWQGIQGLFIERRITNVDSWDGSASRWPDTESYCNSCLINLNEGDPENWTQANCKLPVRNPGDSKDTYVRQAVYAAAARFDQVDAPMEAKDKAKVELIKAYDEMGEEPPEVLTRAISGRRLQEGLWRRILELDTTLPGTDHYLVDVYFDDNGMYVLYVDRGKLYRYSVAVEEDDLVFGEREAVMEVHQPIQTRTTVTRQADGRYRWFSVSGTAVLNRSGEIDSRDLFDSFVAHAEQTGEYPIRQFYHCSEVFRTGQADYLARDEYCYITSGLYDDTPLAQAEIKARQNNPDYWGDSIGFLPTVEPELSPIANGINIPVYRTGINKEISTLPESEAAHLFTRTEVQRMSLDGKAREAFVKLFVDAGQTEEDAEKWLQQNPEARNRAIEDNGLITRNEDDEGQSNEFEIDDSVIEVISRQVVESEAIQSLNAQLQEANKAIVSRDNDITQLRGAISELITRVDKLEGEEQATQRQIDQDTPAKFNGVTRVVYRPREVNGDGQQPSFAEQAQSRLPEGAY